VADDRRKEWLAGLAPGDEVILHSGSSVVLDDLRVITKITPTGRIKVGNYNFAPDGWTHGSDLRGNAWIAPVTAGARDEIVRRKLWKQIEEQVRKQSFRILPLEDMEDALVLLTPTKSEIP
jgi:hypothetical protein